jgi:hypothetical protein
MAPILRAAPNLAELAQIKYEPTSCYAMQQVSAGAKRAIAFAGSRCSACTGGTSVGDGAERKRRTYREAYGKYQSLESQ